MDYVEAARERIELYELSEMTADVRDLADVLLRATETVEIAVGGPARPQGSRRHARSLHRDQPARERGRRDPAPRGRALFKEEKDPIVVMKWKEIYENLENASDRCEDVANIIEGVVLEHA